MSKLLRPEVNIQDYIGARWGVKFVMKGSAVKSVCPFHPHSSANTNLRVWPEKNSYVCSCDMEGGNLWDLVHKHEGLPLIGSPDFDETIRHINRVMGLPDQLQADARPDIKDTIIGAYKALRAALEPIQFSEPNAHYRAGDGIALYRGIDVMTWYGYGVGMLPPEKVRELERQLGPRKLKAAGLDLWDGRYDWLSKGVVVLRKNRWGTPIGLMLRIYDESISAKSYKNKNHELFTSGDYLFGIDQAAHVKNKCPRVYVVEGEFDALSLLARGMPSAVCIGHGRLSDGQLAQLREFGKEIVVVLDTDEAAAAGGSQAGQKSTRDLAARAPELRFLRLPSSGEKMDPDVFAQRYGISAFERLPLESSRMVRMMTEQMIVLPSGNLGWHYATALAELYAAEIAADPLGAFVQRELDYLSGLSGMDRQHALSWVVHLRNQHAIAYAQQCCVPLQLTTAV